MRSHRFFMGICLVAFVLVTSLEQHTPLHGCAAALGRGYWVDVKDEAALIVWNSQSKTEHFIRRADFETQAPDFGFLVPTPSQPDLGEVEDSVFESTGYITAPRKVYEPEVKTVLGFGELWPSLAVTSALAKSPGVASRVTVLDETQVAGFDATVLKADDAHALSEWLENHAYETRPALTEWLKWYVEHGWIITAFKISGNHQGQIATKALRMTFQAVRPFYPYREPEDMRNPSGQGNRTLRVFFLSDRRYEGQLGDQGIWPGKTVWANHILSMVQYIKSRLKLDDSDFAKTLEDQNYLTEFVDESFPRPGTSEIYFQPSKDQSSLERPPIVEKYEVIEYWPGPWGIAWLGIATVGVVGYTIFRKTRRRQNVVGSMSDANSAHN